MRFFGTHFFFAVKNSMSFNHRSALASAMMSREQLQWEKTPRGFTSFSQKGVKNGQQKLLPHVFLLKTNLC